MPALETVLGAEGLAASAWATGGGASVEGRAWVRSLGRAFALNKLSDRDGTSSRR